MTTRETAQRLSIEGREVAIRRGGSGPPVMLIHGWPVSGVFWDNLIPALDPHVHWILVDVPGFGESQVPAGPMSISAQAHRIGALLEALELEDVTLVGHSMGGMIACCLATTPYQARLSRLMAVSAPVWGRRGAYADLRLGTLPLIRHLVVKLMRVPAVRRLVTWRFAPGIRIDERILAATDQAPDEVVIGAALGLLETDLRPVLDRIQVPTRILYGEADHIVTPTQPLMTLARLPGAAIEVYADTGHCPSLEKPDRFVASVLDFVAG